MPERVQVEKAKKWRCSVCRAKHPTKREAERCERLPLEPRFKIGDKFVEGSARLDWGRERHGDSYTSPIYTITDIKFRLYAGRGRKPRHVAVYSWTASRPGMVRLFTGGEVKMLNWLRSWKEGLKITGSKEAGWIKIENPVDSVWRYAKVIPIKGQKKWQIILRPYPRSRRKEILELSLAQIKKFGPEVVAAAKKTAA